MLASEHPEKLVLVKGYARTGVVGHWLGHWWCVDEQGGVVDPTWKNEGTAYVGIETIDVAEYARRTADARFWDLEIEQIAPPELVAQLEAASRALENGGEPEPPERLGH
jgi:hypothetical protein